MPFPSYDIGAILTLSQLNKNCDPNDEHHILRLRDSFIHKSHLCLVFELLSSNLYELIKQNQFQGLSTQLVKVFMAQLLDALTVLKDARLIHCDLKPENYELLQDTWSHRCRKASGLFEYELRQGFKRVDCLGDRRAFWGTWITYNPDSTWQLNLGLAPVKR